MADYLPPGGDPSEMFPKQYSRVLVTNLPPHVSRAVLKQHFEGCQGGKLRVLDIELFRTGETCSAIVTFDDTGGTGVQAILKSQKESLKLAGQELQFSLLYTESTTFTVSELKPDLNHKVIELAKRLNVAWKLEGSKLLLTGPIEFVHHLRIEFDAHIVEACSGSTARMLPANTTPAPYPSPLQSSAPPGAAERPVSFDPSHSPTISDSPHVFSNLSPDILSLLAKIPEGDLPGVQYLPQDGKVHFESRSKEELEDHISKFQTAYQGILGTRRLKVEPVEVPPALDDEKVAQTVASFNEQYSHCVFVYYKDPRVVKVVSTSSRQFDQAKKMLVESLASQPASSVSAKVKFSHREEVIVLPGGQKLTLKKANIVEEEVDVIVNAANGRLQHGGGVAGAINSASHGEVQKYSDRYTSRKGPVPVGQGAWTNAGGALKCKYVFHAVGPDSSHTATECERLLTQVVNLALLRAEKANHTSIAIPAISSGIFGVNKDLVARRVIDTILNFCFTKSPPVLSDIRIVIIDSPTYSCFARYFVQKREVLKQAPRKPLDPVESQSAGIGQLGHPNTVAAPTSEPPPLEQGNPPPLSLPQGQQLDDLRSESNLKPQSTPPLPTEVGQLVDVTSEGNLGPGQNVPWPPGEGQLVDVTSEGNPEPGKNILPGTAHVLTVNHLSALNTHLRCVAQKWQTLGLQLGFTTEMLATLVPTSDGSCDPAINLNKVLSTWLQLANPPATLEALCSALSHATVGEEKLAQSLYGHAVQTTSTEESKLTGQLVDVTSEGNLRSGLNAPLLPSEGQLIDFTSKGNPEPGKNILLPQLEGTPHVLTLNDLSALNSHLRCVAQKWQILGLQLGFAVEVLRALITNSEVKNDPVVYLSRVLFTWVQQSKPPATLEALCLALSHKTVGEEKLAQQLFHAIARPVETANPEGTKPTGENFNGSVPSSEPKKRLAVIFPKAADGLQSAKGDENLIPDANAISYPALYPALPPLDRDGDSSTSHHPGEQLPDSSGHGQPPQKMGEMNPSSGIPTSPTSPTPTTATHTKISTVPVGTDPLSLPTSHGHGQPHTASLQGSWSVPFTVVTATTGTMTTTYSEVAAGGTTGGGGGVPSSKINAGGGGGVSNGHRSQCDNSGGHNKGNHRSKGPSAAAGETEKDCPICLDGFKNPTRTKCGHQFCSACLTKALKYDPYCPTCKHVLRPIVGKQPQGGQMAQKVLHRSLPGYEGFNTIQISYYIPNGVQGQEHPNPGRPFTGTSRTAYLPDTYEGNEVLELLWKAFNARLTFTVGTSVTSGAQNVVVWNDIHHKTSMHGGAYGYPDPTYLQRVKEDLAAKGIVPDSTPV